MAFQERFKGKTSLIDKEGIIGIVKSQSQPITKKNVDFELNANENAFQSPEKKNFKIILKNPETKMKTNQNDTNLGVNNTNQEKLNEYEYLKNKKGNNFVIKSLDQGSRKYLSHSSSPVKVDSDIIKMQITTDSTFYANNNNSLLNRLFHTHPANVNSEIIPINSHLSQNNNNYHNQLVQSQILNNSPYTIHSHLTKKNSNNIYNENINNEFIQKDSLDLYNDQNLFDFSRKNYIPNANNNGNYQIVSNINNNNMNNNISSNYQISSNNAKTNNYSEIHHKNTVIKSNNGLSNLGKSIVFSENTSSDYFRNGIIKKPSINSINNHSNDKDILDFEINKLENQYKEIVDKFNYLTQKRKMMD